MKKREKRKKIKFKKQPEWKQKKFVMYRAQLQ